MAKVGSLHSAVKQAGRDFFYWATSEQVPWHSEPHAHASGQLFSMDSGLALVETEASSFLLSPGRVVWMPPTSVHTTRSFRGVSGWSLYLPARFSRGLPSQPTAMSLSPLLEQIVARIAEWQNGPPAEQVRSRLLAVLGDEIRAAQGDALSLRLPTDERLRGVVKELMEDPSTNRSLEMWSKRIGVSKRSITRAFQEQTGLTFGRWLQRFRVLAAMDRLARGESVTEVSMACGYDSVSAFIRVFRLGAGLTPASFQRGEADRHRVLSQRRAVPLRKI